MRVADLFEAISGLDPEAPVFIRDRQTGWTMPVHYVLEDGHFILYGDPDDGAGTVEELREMGVL